MTDLLDRLKTALADRYRIEQEIGSGGMATVYLAEELKHHRQTQLSIDESIELARQVASALDYRRPEPPPPKFMGGIKMILNIFNQGQQQIRIMGPDIAIIDTTEIDITKRRLDIA